jgi:hypothetical protein
MVESKPKFTKLDPDEEVYYYNKGYIKKLNPKWDGKVPLTNWEIFKKGFLYKNKYIDIFSSNIELMLCLTNLRIFAEPKDWGYAGLLLKSFIAILPVDPLALIQAKKDIGNVEDAIRRARAEGAPLLEINLRDVCRFFKDESYMFFKDKAGHYISPPTVIGIEYMIRNQKNITYILVVSPDIWELHLKSLF